MNKRDDINIYIYTHKHLDYGIWENSLYTPLEVGAALREEHICELRDNTGDNISHLNPLYLETTGLYYIWKNVHTPIKGACQYRRRLEFPEDFDFNTLLEENKVIAPVPLKLGMTLLTQYAVCHNMFDIITCRQVLLELYPDYREAWEKYIVNGKTIYYSNGFILKEKDFDDYCKWLFSIIDTTAERLGFKTIEDVRRHVEEGIGNGFISSRARTDVNYQMEIGAFLSERLFTLYILKNFPDKIAEVPYKKYENLVI